MKIFLFYVVIFLNNSTNAQENGGFEAIPYSLQETAPGMILVEGGIFDFEATGIKKDTVRSFYISTAEETNGQYIAYLNWMKKYYSVATYKKELPDTSVWLQENISDSIKNFLVNNYLRSPLFKDYPVVGVSPEQVIKYAVWKTDRLNEMILIREGILDFSDGKEDSTTVFGTDPYLAGTWKEPVKNSIPSLDPNGGERMVRMEDGIFSPSFRMVTESEWKLAALAIGNKAHAYIKTPKEMSNKKFDKRNYYGYFYINRKILKNEPSLILSNTKSLHSVYNTEQNIYLIHGLSTNVSEWVLGSNGKYIIAGGSWKDAAPDYSTVYNSTNYTFPFPFPSFPESKVSATTGFRLAMSYIGSTVDPRIKRRKAK